MTVTLDTRACLFTPTKETSPETESLEELIQQIQQTGNILEGGWDNKNDTGSNSGWVDSVFDPEKHLAIEAPAEKYTFPSLNLETPECASSHVAGTSPFSLFSPESIPLIRKALFNPRYIERTAAVFGPKTLILRNTAAHSPFFRRLWTHPTVMTALSNAAGVALEPAMETFELGHANVQVDMSLYDGLREKDKLTAIANDMTSGHFAEVRQPSSQGSLLRNPEEIRNQVDASGGLLPWHYDSYPWVCVVMISDTSDMVGGETVVQQGNGTYQGFSQPGMGSAVMLQGGLVKHLALGSTGGSGDRITIITSFRAKSVGIYDSSFMSNIRPYSDLIELYRQWIEYRMARLKPGFRKIKNRKQFLKAVDEEDIRQEEKERLILKEYAKRTLRQIVPPALVVEMAARLGMTVFYTVRDDFANNVLFKDTCVPCTMCDIPNAVVTKFHLGVCPGAKRWRPENPVWSDWKDTRAALRDRDMSTSRLGYDVRFKELQASDYVAKWETEARPWSMADELAVQGLTEYLIEFLEMFGITFDDGAENA